MLCNKKEERRKGKIQLIDATAMKSPLRKNMGEKNCELTSELRDEEYRLAIFSKIAKNTTDGSRQSTLDSIKRMFNISRVVAINGGNAKMRIGIGRYVTANELSLINELDLIIRGAGIGIIYFYWFNDGTTFGFSRGGNNPGNFAGFGKGTFARLLQLEGSLG